MYSYKLTFEAEQDITRIFEYGLNRFGLKQAEKYYDMLFACFNKIASHPLMFPKAGHLKNDYRYCVCGVDAIYYKINGEVIEIITIIGRQVFPK